MFADTKVQALHQQGGLSNHGQFWMLGNKLIRDMQIPNIGIGSLVQNGLQSHVGISKQQTQYIRIVGSNQLLG